MKASSWPGLLPSCAGGHGWRRGDCALLGLQPGDRLLTWSPSTPRLGAVFWGAMMAGVIVVPLDLRMAPAVLGRIAERAGTEWLAIGTGVDAPDPVAGGLGHLHLATLDELTADIDPVKADFPAGWEAQLDGWPRPTRSDLFEIVYTSGTTSQPKGVMLTHGNILSTLEVARVLLPPRPHRVVSLLPLSHLFEQAPVLFYGTMIGAEVLYVRSRNPRVIFESLRELRVTTLVLTPQLLEIFWTAITREIERQGKAATFRRARSLARRLPYKARRLLFRSVHKQLGGELAPGRLGRCLPATRAATRLGRSWRGHPPGLRFDRMRSGLGEHGTAASGGGGRADPAAGAPEAGRGRFGGSWSRAPRSAPATGRTRPPPQPPSTLTAGIAPGTSAASTSKGRLVLSGRTRNIIVLPSGLNVFPEDIEAVLQDHGLSQAVVLETAPGRIEAVVLPPGTMPVVSAGRGGQEERDAEQDRTVRAEIEQIVRTSNATLAVHQRIDAWRIWPEPDFPRTHTLKIRRDAVRAWAAVDVPLQVRDDAPTEVPAAS